MVSLPDSATRLLIRGRLDRGSVRSDRYAFASGSYRNTSPDPHGSPSIRFTAVRAEGWGLLIVALRDQDQEKLRRYEQKMDAAVEIARGLLEQGAQESRSEG